MTLDEARLMANVNGRAQRLFEDGYRAHWNENGRLEIRSGKGAVYLVDTEVGTCDCPFYRAHQGRHPCKHSLGWRRLLAKQRACRRWVLLVLLKAWADLDDCGCVRMMTESILTESILTESILTESILTESIPIQAGDPPFPLGQVVATPGALAALSLAGVAPEALLDRHARGDWGELCENDRAMNDEALSAGERLLSAYALPDGARVWIVTEADRTATTLLLPSEY